MSPEDRQVLIARARRIPIVSTLRMAFVELEQGYCCVEVPYDARYEGVYESFHGGVLTTIADSAACFAILTCTGPDQVLTTTDMNIRFLAPCLGAVRAEARVIKVGRTLCPTQVDLLDEGRRPLALAQVTYMRLPRLPARPS
jgi:uncharacterized protein (TIGR00369 family)